ncbi:MAG: DNA repair protein RecN [Treponema sp.]|nr:DNA repair protein RecN [Treponema sp.]
MLEDLSVKDFALIDQNYLEFREGFTVLSGETGAGKSILIGALSFLLGGKAEVGQIRAGSHEASVTGTFWLPELESFDFSAAPKEGSDLEEVEPESAGQWLMLHGIEPENNRVILRRFIRDNGKSGAFIGSTPVTRADLSQFSSFLVDIHGQHEHQSLMKVAEHRKFLDAKAGITAEVSAFTAMYADLVARRKAFAALISDDGERERKLEMFRFAVSEIENAKLKEKEDETLEEEQSRLSSFEKIYSGITELNQMFSEEESSVVPLLKKIRRESSVLTELDKSLKPLDERVEAAFYELSDLSEEFSSYAQSLVFDPERLKEVQERLSLIYNLKKKYASSVNAPLSEVFEYFDRASEYIDLNSDSNNRKDKMKAEIVALEKAVFQKAALLSKKRKETSLVLSNEVEEILSELGMKGTKFCVNVTEKPGSEVTQKCGPYGIDNIEFLISANPGSPVQPLAKIASGGELSRVMLALKTIFAESDQTGTLIFDEIDTGIGGEVAVSVGKHIKNLSKNRQIFCITHLASIAVYADNQIKIEKGVSEGITSSHVHEIAGDERVREIARMLSGDADTEQSLEHARSLLQKYSGGN